MFYKFFVQGKEVYENIDTVLEIVNNGDGLYTIELSNGSLLTISEVNAKEFIFALDSVGRILKPIKQEDEKKADITNLCRVCGGYKKLMSTEGNWIDCFECKGKGQYYLQDE